MAEATRMTQTQIIKELAENTGVGNKVAKQFLEKFSEIAVRETKKKGVFVMPGIGRLVRVERKARTGRNPATGESIKIPAKKVVKFRIAKVSEGRDRSAEGQEGIVRFTSGRGARWRFPSTFPCLQLQLSFHRSFFGSQTQLKSETPEHIQHHGILRQNIGADDSYLLFSRDLDQRSHHFGTQSLALKVVRNQNGHFAFSLLTQLHQTRDADQFTFTGGLIGSLCHQDHLPVIVNETDLGEALVSGSRFEFQKVKVPLINSPLG